MKKYISSKIKKDLQKFKQLLNKKGYNIQDVIIFGSVAKGENDAHSDIDIAVISPKFGQDYQKEMVKLIILSHKINNLIEPHPFNPEDLDNKYDALANEIKKYGVLVK